MIHLHGYKNANDQYDAENGILKQFAMLPTRLTSMAINMQLMIMTQRMKYSKSGDSMIRREIRLNAFSVKVKEIRYLVWPCWEHVAFQDLPTSVNTLRHTVERHSGSHLDLRSCAPEEKKSILFFSEN